MTNAQPTAKAAGGLIAAVLVAVGAGFGTYYYTAKMAYVAKVNGNWLAMSEFQHRIDGVKRQYAQQMGVNFQNEAGQAVLAELKEKVLSRMIDGELIREESVKRHTEPAKADVDKAFDHILQANFGGDRSKLQARLTQLGLSEAEIRDELADSARTQNVMTAIAGSDAVAEPQAHTYYDAHQREFQRDAEVRASHILVPSLEEALALKDKLDHGADFATLAKQNSKDTGSRDQGGDLGFFGKGKMVPPFEKAAFAAQIGQVTAPVKSQFGYHLIKVTDRHNAGLQPYDQVKQAIIDQLSKETRQKAFRAWLDSTKQQATITYAAGYAPKATPSDAGASPSDGATSPSAH